MVKPNFHPGSKTGLFSKTLLKPKEFENAGFALGSHNVSLVHTSMFTTFILSLVINMNNLCAGRVNRMQQLLAVGIFNHVTLI